MHWAGTREYQLLIKKLLVFLTDTGSPGTLQSEVESGSLGEFEGFNE